MDDVRLLVWLQLDGMVAGGRVQRGCRAHTDRGVRLQHGRLEDGDGRGVGREHEGERALDGLLGGGETATQATER